MFSPDLLKAIDPTGAALDPGQQAAMAGFATLLGGGLAGLAGANAQGGATAAQNEVLNNTDNHTADAAKSGGLVSKVKTAINNAFTAYNDAQAQQALVESSVAQAVGTALAPKVAGGLQVSGGAGMAALGSNLVVGGLASCLETAGFGCLVAAGGGLLTFAGADNMVSGPTLTLTGQYLPTLGSGLVGNALPVDQQTAEAIYGSLTAGLGGKFAPVAFNMPAGFTSVSPSVLTSAELADGGAIVNVNPAELRWTQTTAGGNGRADALRQSMAQNGYSGAPIDVIQTEDGIVTVDHTRAAVALEQGITSIPATLHLPSDPLPADMAGRFGSATTWGDAAAYRAANQRPALPPTGTTTPLKLPAPKIGG